MRPWSFCGDRGTKAPRLASIAAPLLPLSPPPLFVYVFVGLCADLGVRNAVAATGSLYRFYLSLASLPLLVRACLFHIGVRPREMLASLRSVLSLGVLSTPCFLCLLSELFSLLLFLAFPSYCALSAYICLYSLFLCFWVAHAWRIRKGGLCTKLSYALGPP